MSESPYLSVMPTKICSHVSTDPVAWLGSRGFHFTEGEVITDPNNRGLKAMHLASSAGLVFVCEWLWRIGGVAGDTRSLDDRGNTPVMLACSEGHVKVLLWLIAHGASEDIHKPNKNGRLPVLVASQNGHLNVVRLLIGLRAATKTERGTSPLLGAACNERHSVVEWLVLDGAANNSTGHVCFGTFRCAMVPLRPTVRETLEGSLRMRLLERRGILSTILPAVFLGRSTARISTLGGEASILRLIVEYCGLLRGRALRNAQEALEFCNLLLTLAP